MKALALVEAPDHVCCRYRVRAFEPALEETGWSLTLAGLARGTLSRWSQLARAARFDAVLIQRKLLPGWQLQALRRRSRRLVFDFDDAVLYRDSYHARGPQSWNRSRRFARTVRLADAVIAGNDFLADCALRAGARADRVRVIPTCVQAARDPNPPLDTRSAGGLDLVWIGSSSTLQGLERSRPLWERLGRTLPGVRLRVICDRFPRFDALPVLAAPWSEATEADALASGDVGISWVPDDVWSLGKCGLKILQYQAAGLPVIANPVGVHTEMIVPGISGFLATTEDEWIEAVRTLAADPALRGRMGRAGRASVEERYAVSVWAPDFVSALTGAPSARSSMLGRRAQRDREFQRSHWVGARTSSNSGAHPH